MASMFEHDTPRIRLMRALAAQDRFGVPRPGTPEANARVAREGRRQAFWAERGGPPQRGMFAGPAPVSYALAARHGKQLPGEQLNPFGGYDPGAMTPAVNALRLRRQYANEAREMEESLKRTMASNQWVLDAQKYHGLGAPAPPMPGTFWANMPNPEDPAGVQEVITNTLGANFAGGLVANAIDEGLQRGVGKVAGAMPIIGNWGKARGVPGQELPPTIDELREGMPATTQVGLVHPDPIPTAGAGRRGQLRPGEAQAIEESVISQGGRPADVEQVKDLTRDYRRTHSPQEGWQPFEVRKALRNRETGAFTPTYSAGGFDFGRGNFTPDQRAELVERGTRGLVSDVQEVAARAQRGDPNAINIMNQARWYRDAQDEFRSVFGADSELYGNLQGAMSPNTKLGLQHKMADEFFHRALRGDFDWQVEGLRRHLDAGGSVNNVPDEFIPRKLSGAKYGQNGKNALLVLMNRFDQIEAGQGPKMRNFAANLAGTSTDPTIDIWAARSMQRLLGGDRPLPVLNAVPGEYHPGYALGGKAGRGADVLGFEARPGDLGFGEQGPKGARGGWEGYIQPEVSASYGIGRDAFNDAALQLGMSADDLQALMWFREKELWEQAGHTPVDTGADLAELFRRQYGEGGPGIPDYSPLAQGPLAKAGNGD